MMCDFEDFPIISKYPLSQAIMDGILTRISMHDGKPVVATAHILADISTADLLKVLHELCARDIYTKAKLPEEEQLFTLGFAGRTVWVIRDGAAYTIMYPEDY